MVVYIHSRSVCQLLKLTYDRLSCINHGIAVSWQDSDADCREPLIVNDDQITADLAEKRHTYPSGTNAPFCGMTIFFCQMNLCQDPHSRHTNRIRIKTNKLFENHETR